MASLGVVVILFAGLYWVGGISVLVIMRVKRTAPKPWFKNLDNLHRHTHSPKVTATPIMIGVLQIPSPLTGSGPQPGGNRAAIAWFPLDGLQF